MEENKNNNSNLIENLQGLSSSFYEILEPIVKSINSIRNNLIKTINTPEFEDLAKKIIFFANNHEKFNEKLSEKFNEANKLLDTYNWFIPDSISFYDFQEKIFTLLIKENITQNDIDKAFLDFYFGNNFEELEDVVNNLKENIEEDRFLIIKDCFNILKDNFESKNCNCFNIIIPTLLIHIDRYRLDVEKDYLKSKNRKLKEGEKPSKVLLEEVKKDNAHYKVSIPIEFLIEKLFRDSKEIDKDINNGKNLIDDLYRHKIMHGQHLKYGSAKNVLKCFLILEYIKNLHNTVKNQSTNKGEKPT